jgi:hypothetical protein
VLPDDVLLVMVAMVVLHYYLVLYQVDELDEQPMGVGTFIFTCIYQIEIVTLVL